MKLLRQTNIYSISLSAILLLIAGIILYFILTGIINEEINEKLIVNYHRIAEQVENGEHPAGLPPIIEVKELHNVKATPAQIKDTTMYDPYEKDMEPFRQVSGVVLNNQSAWRITVRRVVLEPHDYLQSIGTALIIVFILLLSGFLLINKLISIKVWKPFYANIETLKSFSITQPQQLQLQATHISEFRDLNHTLSWLTDKVQSDYRVMKEFSENAAHEMQTPLAIVRAKMEDALQDPGLTENMASQINQALSAANRLAQLNKSLLTLAKVENHQFTDIQDIEVDEIIHKMIQDHQSFMEAKQIHLSLDLHPLTIKADPLLMNMLISNLVNNAIKHNRQEGEITITTSNRKISIINTGEPLKDPESMFERFSKANASSASTGLGLAIVKKICEIYDWKISYTTDKLLHKIEIRI